VLTAERYRPDPFLGGDRLMFRTRDLGRWTRDGQLEHHGRTDDQVKVRGFRVELDAVTSALEGAVDCRRATTLLHDGKLVGFISPASAVPEQARRAVAERLPYYCVPTLIVPVDTLPTTERGKVDRRALLSRLDGQKETVA
jgi:D-alanine--poly(phosphoribitol) ligase subunit 1